MDIIVALIILAIIAVVYDGSKSVSNVISCPNPDLLK